LESDAKARERAKAADRILRDSNAILSGDQFV
jgi:hypothetical protein